MSKENAILITKLCAIYGVERSFFEELDDIGLIEIRTYEQESYLPADRIGDFEKILRIRQELQLNPEGIDVVFNLLERIQYLQNELRATQRQLDVFRSGDWLEDRE